MTISSRIIHTHIEYASNTFVHHSIYKKIDLFNEKYNTTRCSLFFFTKMNAATRAPTTETHAITIHTIA